jgi:hypothetical protein
VYGKKCTGNAANDRSKRTPHFGGCAPIFGDGCWIDIWLRHGIVVASRVRGTSYALNSQYCTTASAADQRIGVGWPR